MNTQSKPSPWEEYWKKCDVLMAKATTLVKERIKGTRKGSDEPNYLHSFRVKDLVSKNHHWDDPDYDLFIAALLHDIVEDGGVPLKELKEMGYSDRTIELVDLCTHRDDIENKTERWMHMITRLVDAKDEDAWRIKLADLADNLTQSKGLSLDNRKFMIEVKAPLLLRLGHVSYSAYSQLMDEMEKQRKDFERQSKYVVTQWIEEYDIDGLFDNFAFLGEFEDRCDAVAYAVSEIEAFIKNRLDTKGDWNDIIRDGEVRESFSKPNKLNNVVFKKSAARRDKTGYDSLYCHIDVIEVPIGTTVNSRLFNSKECGFEVYSFFNKNMDKKTEDERFAAKRKRIDYKPTLCQLWKKTELSDGDFDNAFDIKKTYTEDSHFSRRLIKCKECNQLYVREFYEEIDWIDGEDPQYMTYIPVRNEKEAELIAGVDLYEFQTFSPRINRDWPKGAERKTYWIGR
jgi:hypothetical protein